MNKTEELIDLIEKGYNIKWCEKKQKFFQNGKPISRRKN